jgi:hypothetical protein
MYTKDSLTAHYVAGNDRMNPLVFIIYDSIYHSIFEGQVLAPLLKKLNTGIYTKIQIISFEEELSSAVLTAHKKFSTIDPRITITVFKRSRFIMQTLLWKQAQQLKTILKTVSCHYELSARGPLAGIIAKQAATELCTLLTIQARGLLAEEHAYTHKKSSLVSSLMHALRKQQLYYLEKNAYAPPLKKQFSFIIEAVSPALKEYLINAYAIPANIFTFPLCDIPTKISPKEKLHHRTRLRSILTIDTSAPVYVYNGSLKAWQCPQETIAVFKEAWKKNSTSIFLALTQDNALMKKLLEQANIPKSSYRVLFIPQDEVLNYLCAADYGIIFREAHQLNWVSRPTKLLEYQAAGLQVLHNNTIELLARKD